MSFSESIPNKLSEYRNVSAFMNVLDRLQEFKVELISGAFRTFNSAVLLDKKWLLKNLSEFGITIPLEYPIQIISQYLLNVDNVCRTRGSKIGLELYCSLLSFGEVYIDDKDFCRDSELLMLDSAYGGYITETNTRDFYYLCDDSDIINREVTLKITIKSKYFNGQYPNEERVIKSYIESTIGDQLGFSPNKNVLFNFEPRDDFYFHNLLNPYFI